MEPEVSLPNSQALATCPYPEPDQSSQFLLITRNEDPSPSIWADDLTKHKIDCGGQSMLVTSEKAAYIIQNASRETDVLEINSTPLIFSVEFIWYHEMIRYYMSF